MIWVAWRQFRTQSWIALVGFAVAAVALVLTAMRLADLYASATACQTACGQALEGFRNQADAGVTGIVYQVSVYGMYLVPPLVGAFWGAPLVARELESGTYRLAWNQTVTRSRWLVTKLALVGGAAMLTTGLLSLVATTTLHHVDSGNLVTPTLFGVRGVVPVAYTAFAFALGVAAGVLIRRVVPAMAVTLGVYIAAVLTMTLAVRGHLMPVRTLTAPITDDRGSINGISMDQNGVMHVFGGAEPPFGAWTVSNQTLTHAGAVFTGPANAQFCGENGNPDSCIHWLGTLNLHQSLAYQPASHFWPLQWIEGGIFVGLALLLAGFALWWTRRRLS